MFGALIAGVCSLLLPAVLFVVAQLALNAMNTKSKD